MSPEGHRASLWRPAKLSGDSLLIRGAAPADPEGVLSRPGVPAGHAPHPRHRELPLGETGPRWSCGTH
jgi:hypothetical protein